MMDKRGEEGGSSIGVIVGIVIVVVVAIVLLYSFTGAFDFLKKAASVSPGDLQVMIDACGGYASIGAIAEEADYCTHFQPRTINGLAGFYNCQYAPIEEGVKKNFALITCTSAGYLSAAQSAESECKIRMSTNTLDPGTYINGKLCPGTDVATSWECKLNDPNKPASGVTCAAPATA